MGRLPVHRDDRGAVQPARGDELPPRQHSSGPDLGDGGWQRPHRGLHGLHRLRARIGSDTGPILSTGNLHGQANVNADANLKFNFAASNTIAFGFQNFPTISIGQGNTLRLGQYGGIFKQDTPTANNSLLYVGGSGTVQSGNGVEVGGLSTQDWALRIKILS